jgi:hypothetical protein
MVERVKQAKGAEQLAKFGTAPAWTRPTKGRYSLDLDDLYDQAAKAVLARGDIVAQLGELQNPPDLGGIIAAQREVLGTTVTDQVTRCVTRAGKLHDLLVLQLDPVLFAELDALVQSADHTDDPGSRMEIEKSEVALLTGALPAAQQQSEFRTLVTEWESQRNEIRKTLESSMLSVALTALNTALTDESSRMRVTSFDGLRQGMTTERIVITDVYERLEDMIRERHEGSFGIAGPRGVGKSTLINFFATTQGIRGRDSKTVLVTEDEPNELATGEPSRLGVVVSAPVAYDAREFVLHLYAELCKRVLGVAAVRWRRDHGTDLRRVTSQHAQIGLTALGASAVTGGLATLASARQSLAVSPAVPRGVEPGLSPTGQASGSQGRRTTRHGPPMKTPASTPRALSPA